MRKGKQDAAGQAARRQQIIDYIKTNGTVKSGEICKALSLSRSSLSDDINAINAQAPLLLSPKRGYYVYNAEASAIIADDGIRGRIDRRHIRQWMIISLLSEYEMTMDDLREELSDRNITCSEASLYEDIRMLRNEHYIEMRNEGKTILYSSSFLCKAGSDEIASFRKNQMSGGKNPKVSVGAYETLAKKLSHCILGISSTSVPERRIGKLNHLSKEQLDMYDRFRQLPYAAHALSILYQTNRGSEKTCHFFTGMFIYSVETNRIYLVGKDQEGLQTIIGLDRIHLDGITVLPDRNYVYDAPEYRSMFDEMFHLSTEDPVRVSVRFQNFPSVADKIRRLCTIRPDASLTLVNDEKELLYQDTIRGLDNFARYLRSFGRSVIVDGPAELKEKILFTSRRVLSIYESLPDAEEGAEHG